MISWNRFPNFFDHVRCSNSCWLSTVFAIFKIFTAISKSCIPFKSPYTRDSTATTSVFYQLVSFSSCCPSWNKLMFALCSITVNCHSDLHGTKP
jgi:hypothetical protein